VKKLPSIAVFLCLATILVTSLSVGCSKGAQPTTTNSSTTPLVSTTLSEQPDKVTFQKYFSELGLGKLPANAKSPADLQKNATIFASGENLVLYGSTIVPQVPISAKYYDVMTKQSITSSVAPPAQPKATDFSSWESVSLSSGRYELKVYVGDVLVAVFPFEIR